MFCFFFHRILVTMELYGPSWKKYYTVRNPRRNLHLELHSEVHFVVNHRHESSEIPFQITLLWVSGFSVYYFNPTTLINFIIEVIFCCIKKSLIDKQKGSNELYSLNWQNSISLWCRISTVTCSIQVHFSWCIVLIKKNNNKSS